MRLFLLAPFVLVAIVAVVMVLAVLTVVALGLLLLFRLAGPMVRFVRFVGSPRRA